jgi:hypothetical protein
MTADEIINTLIGLIESGAIGRDTRVVVPGIEGGYVPIESVTARSMEFNPESDFDIGPWDEPLNPRRSNEAFDVKGMEPPLDGEPDRTKIVVAIEDQTKPSYGGWKDE